MEVGAPWAVRSWAERPSHEPSVPTEWTDDRPEIARQSQTEHEATVDVQAGQEHAASYAAGGSRVGGRGVFTPLFTSAPRVG